MQILKLIGYSIVVIVGFCLALGIGAAITAFSAVIGTVALGAVIVFFGALALQEYWESRPK